ncbi:MAG TPA: DUF6599 family protein [Myxococcales bacterium]|jgi:hypothetical protein
MPRLAAVAAGVWLALGAGPASAAESTPDFASKLPAQVGEWKKPAKPQRYDCKTLYDYIDGGAELYLAFDFAGATTFEYSAGKDDEIKVDIFDMGSPRGAFGAFAHGRETIAAEVGQGSEYAGGLLTFWKHRYYVSVLGFPETQAKRKAVYELGQAIAALIPGTGPLPAIIGALPKKGLVEASVRTFHHHLLQNDYVTVSHDNLLGIGPKPEAVLARYDRDGEKFVLMLVDYPAEAEAKAAQGRFTDGLPAGAVVAQKDGQLGIGRKGKRLALVLAARTKLVVDQVLSEVP